MRKVSNWEKFQLLFWKNFTLQWANKRQLIIELLLPAIFAGLLVLVRQIVEPDNISETHFPPLNITNLDLFKKKVIEGIGFRKLIGSFLRRYAERQKLRTKMPSFVLPYSPKNEILDGIMTKAAGELQLMGVESFENAEQLQNALIASNYFAGVQFDDSLADITDYPMKLSFAVRFPSELRTAVLNLGFTWLTTRLFPIIQVNGPRNHNETDGGIPVGYLREGFIPVQQAVTMSYLKLASKNEDIPEVVMQRYPYGPFIFDILLQGLMNLMPAILVLSFIYPCTYIVKYITMEKEKQLKEVMKIMGLPNWLHWTAWFAKSFIMLAISTLIILVLLKIKWSNEVAVLTYSSWTAVYLFLIVYTIASICFCFMLAVFFSRASTAAAVTGLLLFISYVPFTFMINHYTDLTVGEKLAWSLVLNTGMSFGVKVILDYEGAGEGLQWNNIFKPVSIDDNLTLGSVILVMLCSAIIYLIICLYVEQIFPGRFGVPRPWYFPFSRAFWCGEQDYVGIEDTTPDKLDRNPNAFEEEPLNKKIGLQIKNLKRRYGKKWAVNGISLNMYQDEICVLLGHNGAGKTTTISMLVGMFPPTSGTAVIHGNDIRNNLSGARQSLGICPQHNVLFDDMSVANHLIFFSRLKGLRGDEVKEEVNKYLKMIELEDKANVQSCKLSGGMKRKLSVCCALCGDTKVVLCDEPSSGMDPSARRQLWDLLQAEKKGRTLLLTTHFMDEADILGDRIAIMCDGELRCHGTSFFLKKKFGSGYHLICVKRSDCNSMAVTALLNRYIPGLQPETDIGTELSYQLPYNYSPIFEEMFAALENNADSLKLNGFGVSIASMEEVFMKVGAEDSIGLKRDSSMTGRDINLDDAESERSDNLFIENSTRRSGLKLYVNQWNAMFLKKMLNTRRNILLLLVQNIMPIFFVAVTIMVGRQQGLYRELVPMTMSVNQYPSTVTVLETRANVLPDSLEERIAQNYKTIIQEYGPKHEFESTGTKTFSDYILDLGKTVQVRVNARYLAAATVENGKLTAWLNNRPLHTAPLTVNLINNAMARALLGPEAEITVTNAPLPFSPNMIFTNLETGNNVGASLAFNICFCMAFVSSFYVLFVIKERESRSKLLQFVGGVYVSTFWITQFIWDTVTFVFTCLVLVITLACFQEDGYAKPEDLSRVLLFLFIFAVAVIPLTYLQSMCFSDPPTGFARIATINIFAGLALYLVVMLLSLPIFDTKPVGDMLQWFFRVIPHFSLAMGINRLYQNWAIKNACGNEFIAVLPDALRCQLVPKCCHETSYFAWEQPGILPETIYLLSVAVGCFLLTTALDYNWANRILYNTSKLIRRSPPKPHENELDDDVANEKKRIDNMSPNEIAEQNLVLNRVTKYYRQFLAVNEVSLCVKRSECFGLLGVNGAGKTTTFKMMTGDERISYGTAYVKGMNMSSQLNDIYKEIGYCPQFDALLEDLTGRETLRIFCLLRGIPRRYIRQISENLARSFGFMKHIDKPVNAYSGGNKRKLSTAIAVIGSPSVIYLDEPTTGMDPAARRQLWNMVCRIRDAGKSIVLTSHSMEECEALCTRLAIMVNGEFQCMGSTQHLKNKFSKGLVLKVKVAREIDSSLEVENGEANTAVPIRTSIELRSRRSTLETTPSSIFQVINNNKVKAFVMEMFPESILQEEFGGMLTFYIPLDTIKWSKIFGVMESNREKLKVEDYSVSQTTLEEIFLEFAKYQREDPRVKKKSKLRLCECCKNSTHEKP